MNSLKIIVCTTFRDFKGTENDEIQRAFLKSLENQTYKNFEVVVTLFSEKKVKEEVGKFKFDSYFYNSVVDIKHRYSLTKVLLNAIDHANKKMYYNYIILWTTCDVIYDYNFFETIIRYYNSNIIGTSHPHIIFPSLKDFENKKNKSISLFSGFDVIYFDKEFLQIPEVKLSIEKYIFNDWGFFEFFLIALNEFSNTVRMINIYEESKVYKVENNRFLTNESNEFFLNSYKLNFIIFNKFVTENKIVTDYFDLTYCHLKFDLTINKFKHYFEFSNDIFKYVLRKIKKSIASFIPNNIKSIIKGGTRI